ncbi:hypothetical protein ACQP0C_18470 [Nocardia sp. CA-129566]|uniref:FAD-dependent oxidoreductase n=1 Tax=Nocardia sp. CA-129566 TaxID=3239976 RepID=UPI003D97F823
MPLSTIAPSDSDASTDTSTPHNHVAIIGTGFGGIATAVRLRRAGFTDFPSCSPTSKTSPTPRGCVHTWYSTARWNS